MTVNININIIYIYYTGISHNCIYYYYTYNSHIKKTCFPDAYQKKHKLIRKYNETVLRKVFINIDIWNSTLNNELFLGITIHYIDSNWTFKHFLLDIISFRTQHTGVNIAEAKQKTLDDYNLSK